MPRTLNEWVDYIQTLHHREIELSLDRIRDVYARLLPDGVPFKVVSVSGTNGKGSSVELISSIFRSGGYSVAKYTSPHLVKFNERINIAGKSVADDDLLGAFERVEDARGSTPITFFEFSTLVAIDCFARAKVDLAIMEVGLGGRLDAVNILDADVSAITSISLDHTSWLGNTVEEIAVEKGGIARLERPCILGMAQPVQSLLDSCEKIGAITKTKGKDFDHVASPSGWEWQRLSGAPLNYPDLPLPFNQSGFQLDNAALAIAVATELQDSFPISQAVLKRGLSDAQIKGRCQIVSSEPMIILDVAHNESSVAGLATFVAEKNILGKTVAVCGMLRDKEISQSLDKIAPLISDWHVSSLEGDRGTSANQLATILREQVLAQSLEENSIIEHANVIQAYSQAIRTLTADDCLVVFGSFFVIGDILALLDDEQK